MLGAGAPSNKITLGVIGVGAQGTQDMVNFLGLKFVNDEAANKMLQPRDFRGDWKLQTL